MKFTETHFFFIVVLLSIIFLSVGNYIASGDGWRPDDTFTPDFYNGVITEIIERDASEMDFGDGFFVSDVIITFSARLTSGDRSGEEITARQLISTMFFTGEREVRDGDRVVLVYDAFNSDFFFANFIRINAVMVLGGVFLMLVVLFGRKKGFSAIVALGITCMAVFLVFIPAILSGRNIYIVTIIVCVFSIVSTLMLVIGPNKKALSAMLGCLGGVLAAGLLMYIMDFILSLTGVLDGEAQSLLILPTDNPIDLRAIVFAGVIIGAVGAIMDVAMSIASSLWEVKETGHVNDFGEIVKSGISIGKDILGTMLNTLILAYIGSSLSLILIITAHTTSFIDLFNMELIIVEFLRALVGSFGMLLAIPLTALVSGWLYSSEESFVYRY